MIQTTDILEAFMNQRLFLWILPFLLLAESGAQAMQFSAGEKTGVNINQIVTEDWYAAGETVTLNGTVLQDAFLAGSQVTVWGTVVEDVNAAGVDVSLRGKIGDDVRAVGGQILLSSMVGGSALLIGREVRLGENAVVVKDLTAIGQDVMVQGVVSGGARLIGRHVLLRGRVDGPVLVKAESLFLGPGARITGELTYESPAQLTIDPSARVDGPIHWDQRPGAKAFWNGGSPFSLGTVLFKISVLLGLLAVGVLLILLLPDTAARTAAAVRHRPWSSLGMGLATLFGVPMAMVVFLLTVIGIPLALVLGAFYVAALFIARMAVGLMLGMLLFRPNPEDRGRRLLSFGAGFILLTVLGWLPVAGFLINAAAILLGLGAMWLAPGMVVSPAPAGSTPATTDRSEKETPGMSEPPNITEAQTAPETQAPGPMATPTTTAWQPSVPAFRQGGVHRTAGTRTKTTQTARRGKTGARRPARKAVNAARARAVSRPVTKTSKKKKTS